MGEIETLKLNIANMYDEYQNTGPGALTTTLDDGLVKMDEYDIKIKTMNTKKNEYVNNQKLFNLKISNFPKLVEIDKDLK